MQQPIGLLLIDEVDQLRELISRQRRHVRCQPVAAAAGQLDQAGGARDLAGRLRAASWPQLPGLVCSQATRDERYDYLYDAAELRPWVARISDIAARLPDGEVYAVTNNHHVGKAVVNAEMNPRPAGPDVLWA